MNNIATASRDSMCDALVDDVDVGSADASGDIQIYTAGFATLLATLTFAAPRSVSGGEGDPELVLHYSAKDGMHQYRAHYSPQKQQSLLPSRQTGSALTPVYPNAR